MTQDELKAAVAEAALAHVLATVPAGTVLGVGTGSTANLFIDRLAAHRDHFAGAVSSSEASSARLRAAGIEVLDPNAVTSLPVYVDGADEIDGSGAMIKGGGGALTREKIVASIAERFVCIADGSKRVEVLGRFPLPVEVIPMARAAVARRLEALGGAVKLRLKTDGSPFVTDNGGEILDVSGLSITAPAALEAEIGLWPGVVCVGLFARRGADLLLLGTATGVEETSYKR